MTANYLHEILLIMIRMPRAATLESDYSNIQQHGRHENPSAVSLQILFVTSVSLLIIGLHAAAALTEAGQNAIAISSSGPDVAGAQCTYSRISRNLQIIAHRGARAFAPENTIPAIEKAIEMRLDFVEVDVMTTRDGRLVLMHDPDVNRTTDGTGFVCDMTLAQIKSLDAGIRFNEAFAGTRIPTLEEAAEAAKGRIQLYLHWKQASADSLEESIRDGQMWDMVIVLGWVKDVVKLKRLDPRIRTAADVYTPAQLYEALRLTDPPYAVSPGIGWLTPGIMKACQAAGVKVFADMIGTDDIREGVRRAIGLNVDAVQIEATGSILDCLTCSNILTAARADESTRENRGIRK